MGNAENPATGANFENAVQAFFKTQNLQLRLKFPADVGASVARKPHTFDLGCAEPATLVECKCHTWTSGGNAPSAKLSVWNEAMFYFAVSPASYRKILAVLTDLRGTDSIAEHYVRRFGHLVPRGVEIWEISRDGKAGRLVFTGG